MRQTTEHTIGKGIANTFGSFGYLFCFLQWLWAAMLYLTVIKSITSLVSPSGDIQPVQASGPTLTVPDPAGMIILVIIVVVMVIVTVYSLISIPRNIIRTSNKIVHGAAETMAPLVIRAQHKQDTKRLRMMITSGLAFVIKVLLIIIPLALTATSKLLEEQSIDYSIAMTVGFGVACFSTAAFSLQYLLAKLLHVKTSDLW